MPNNDKDITVGIHQVATGDGAKKTGDDIELLEEKTQAAKATAKGLRQELAKMDDISEETRKEVNRMADSFAAMAKRGNRAIERIKALGRQEDKVGVQSKDLGNGIYDAQKRIDDLGKSSGNAEQRLKGLERQQKRNNKAAEQTPVAMNRAGKSQRNMGLAALEASRAVEDMQYGIRGVINNIPQLLLFLGGSAGLTAAISLLVVGLAQLVPLLGDSSDAMKANADAADAAAKRKIKAARAEREAARELESQIARNKLTLDQEIESVLKSVRAIDEQTAARSRAFTAQQQIANVLLSRDIALINADDSLSDFEKVTAIIELKRQADEARRAAERQKLQDDFEDEKNKILAVDESLDQTADKRLQNIFRIQREIEAGVRGIEDLQQSLEETKRTFSESTIPALDKTLNTEAAKNTLKTFFDPFTNNGSFFAPDRDDFDSDDAFITEAKKFANNRDEGPGLKTTKSLLQSIEFQKQQIEKTEELIAAEKKRIEGLREDLKLEEEIREKAIASRNAQIEKSQKQIQLLKEQKAAAEELIKAEQSRDDALDAVRSRDAARKSLTSSTSGLIEDTREKLEESGASATQLQQLNERGEQLQKATAKAVEDGKIDVQEKTKLNAAAADFFRTAGQKDTELLNLITGYESNQRQLIKTINAMDQRMRSLESAQQSR